jgi:hypothetical protein
MKHQVPNAVELEGPEVPVRHRRGICARATATGRQSPEDPLSTCTVAPGDEDDTNNTCKHWPASLPSNGAGFFLTVTALSTGPD